MIDSDRIRIAVAIARSGIASRRGAEEIVRQRRVTVDGQVATDLSLRVNPQTQRITLDGRPLPSSEPLRYYALNKPLGVLSTARDDRGRQTVVDLLPANAPRCVPVGTTRSGQRRSDPLDQRRTARHRAAAPVARGSAGLPGRGNRSTLGRVARPHPQRHRGRRRHAPRQALSLAAARPQTARSTIHVVADAHPCTPDASAKSGRLCDAIGHPIVTLRRVRFRARCCCATYREAPSDRSAAARSGCSAALPDWPTTRRPRSMQTKRNIGCNRCYGSPLASPRCRCR